MPVSTHTKSTAVGWIDTATGLALKLGAPAVVLATAVLVSLMFGGHIRGVDAADVSQKAYLINTVGLCAKALMIGGIAAIVAVVMRLPRDEAVGQILAFVSALFYFGSPALFVYLTGPTGRLGTTALKLIIYAYQMVGAVGLVIGLVLVLRDCGKRIWIGISVRRVAERRWGDEERRKKPCKPGLLSKCWDMPFCQDFVRQVCPAWEAKKPCWRIKCGCYCDERTILRALTGRADGNVHARGIMENLGLNKPAEKSALSAKLRRDRCRRCSIYAERQRLKYRFMSPMVFPVVGGLMFAFYSQISRVVWAVLEKTDKFASFLTYKSADSVRDFSADGHMLTTLLMIWLGIIAVSYALKAVEYLVFELQV